MFMLPQTLETISGWPDWVSMIGSDFHGKMEYPELPLRPRLSLCKKSGCLSLSPGCGLWQRRSCQLATATAGGPVSGRFELDLSLSCGCHSLRDNRHLLSAGITAAHALSAQPRRTLLLRHFLLSVEPGAQGHAGRHRLRDLEWPWNRADHADRMARVQAEPGSARGHRLDLDHRRGARRQPLLEDRGTLDRIPDPASWWQFLPGPSLRSGVNGSQRRV